LLTYKFIAHHLLLPVLIVCLFTTCKKNLIDVQYNIHQSNTTHTINDIVLQPNKCILVVGTRYAYGALLIGNESFANFKIDQNSPEQVVALHSAFDTPNGIVAAGINGVVIRNNNVFNLGYQYIIQQAIAFNNNYLFAGGLGSNAFLFITDTTLNIMKHYKFNAEVSAIAPLPNSTLWCSGLGYVAYLPGDDSVWQYPTITNDWYTDMAFDTLNNQILVCGFAGCIASINISDKKVKLLQKQSIGTSRKYTCITMLNSNTAVAAGNNSLVSIINIATGNIQHLYCPILFDIKCIKPINGNSVIIGGSDGKLITLTLI
jgi:WD40 repeat protein